MKIGKFDFTRDKTYIVAEVSANHNGSLQTALDTIKAAKQTGEMPSKSKHTELIP